MHKLFLLFLIYSILGWVVEVVYVFIRTKRLENRGFFYMPIVPIYGFGALLIIYGLDSINNPINLFITAFILTTILEYFTSFIMEYLFDMHWWDYSDEFLNINGRVCLLNSSLFGLLSVFVISVLNPVIYEFVYSLDSYKLIYITNFFLVTIIFDFYYTLVKLDKIPHRDIRFISSKVYEVDGEFFDEKGKEININKLLIVAKLQDIIKHPSFIALFIISILISLLLLILTSKLAIALSTFDALLLIIVMVKIKKNNFKINIK